MKLWLISQDKNNDYDTYDSAVVAAETEDDARNIHPGGESKNTYGWTFAEQQKRYWANESPHEYMWTSPAHVSVVYLGEAKDGQESDVICASFNAG